MFFQEAFMIEVTEYNPSNLRVSCLVWNFRKPEWDNDKKCLNTSLSSTMTKFSNSPLFHQKSRNQGKNVWTVEIFYI